MEKSIRIYRFINPAIIVQNPNAIKFICGTDRNNQKNIELSINSKTGYFIFEDNTFDAFPNLKIKYSIPQTEQEALIVVQEILAKFNKQRQESYLKNLKFPNLFANLAFQAAVPLFDVANKMIESWEITYLPYLQPSFNETKVPVMNEAAEKR